MAVNALWHGPNVKTNLERKKQDCFSCIDDEGVPPSHLRHYLSAGMWKNNKNTETKQTPKETPTCNSPSQSCASASWQRHTTHQRGTAHKNNHKSCLHSHSLAAIGLMVSALPEKLKRMPFARCQRQSGQAEASFTKTLRKNAMRVQ